MENKLDIIKEQVKEGFRPTPQEPTPHELANGYGRGTWPYGYLENAQEIKEKYPELFNEINKDIV